MPSRVEHGDALVFVLCPFESRFESQFRFAASGIEKGEHWCRVKDTQAPWQDALKSGSDHEYDILVESKLGIERRTDELRSDLLHEPLCDDQVLVLRSTTLLVALVPWMAAHRWLA